jgi:hypothetical protein
MASEKTTDVSDDLRDTTGEPPVGEPPEKKPPPVAKVSYDEIAERACKMAGGECVSAGTAFAPGNVLVAGINCRPEVPGIFCARLNGVCKGSDEYVCCGKDAMTGKDVARGIVSCDRGYPVCLGYGMWLATSRSTCSQPLSSDIPEDAPNLWGDAVDVQSAARWACKEAHGHFIEREEYAEAVEKNEYDSLCAGEYTILFSDFGRCCIPKAACPEQDDKIECCNQDGTLAAKVCRDGTAMCFPSFVARGFIREVPRGTCQAF